MTNEPTLEQIKEGQRSDWAGNAEGWSQWVEGLRAQTAPFTRLVLSETPIEVGDRVLDIASGSGEPALSIARAVGDGGHVTATDLVTEMLEIVEREAKAEGLTNISFQQADAADLPFDDESFDIVTCRFGIMFVPEADRALQETLRVLRPGGRASWVVWGGLDQNPPMAAVMGTVARHFQPPPPPPDAPTPFRFAEPGSLSRRIEAAGFAEVREQTFSETGTFPGDAERFWEMTQELAASLLMMLSRADDGERQQVVDKILDALRALEHDGTLTLPGVVHVATARKA